MDTHDPQPPGAREGRAERPRPDDGIESAIRRARRRLLAARLLRALPFDVGIALGAVCLLLVVDRLAFPGAALPGVAWGLVGLAIAVSLLRGLAIRRPDRIAVAAAIDERLGLKERVSSLLYLRSREAAPADGPLAGPGGWSPDELVQLESLVARDAARCLAGASVEGAFPIRGWRRGAWVVAPMALAIGLALWAPVLDLLGIARRREARAAVEESVRTEKDALEKKLAAIEKEAEETPAPEAKRLLELLRKALDRREEPAPRGGGSSPGEPRKDAMVELAKLEDMAAKAMEAEPFDRVEKMTDALGKLDLRESELTRALAEALKEGRPGDARDAIRGLEASLSEMAAQAGGPTEAQRRQLDALAREFSRLAKDALGKEGSKASRNADLKRLASALEKASASCRGADLPRSLRDLASLGQQLSALQDLAFQRQLLDQALSMVRLSKQNLASLRPCSTCGKPSCPACGKPTCACQGRSGSCSGGQCAGGGSKAGLGSKPGAMAGASPRAGSVSSGRPTGASSSLSASTGPNAGLGAGARPGGSPEPTAFRREHLSTDELGPPDDPVGSLLVEGPSGTAEVRIEKGGAVERAIRDHARAVETEPLPAEHRELVRRFYEGLLGETAGTGPDATSEEE